MTDTFAANALAHREHSRAIRRALADAIADRLSEDVVSYFEAGQEGEAGARPLAEQVACAWESGDPEVASLFTMLEISRLVGQIRHDGPDVDESVVEQLLEMPAHLHAVFQDFQKDTSALLVEQCGHLLEPCPHCECEEPS